MDSTQRAFLKELKDLLNKYNANIGFCVSDGSDTYGLADERIEISINDKTILQIPGWGIDGKNLR